ncbi:SirB2 family protein [Rouxiella sp. Mn2063]|uniref:SirB2 family protein n=1 Tax=Rouxiella sp. Mn2063 TaxID=3395262 RepID=UPI003BC1F960
MSTFLWVKNLHIVVIILSISLFVLRFFWMWSGSSMLQKKWVKITPHINDTVVLVSGFSLMFQTSTYPFSADGTWLTEKLFGVIIYIVLGFIALSKRPRSQKIRWIAFILAMGCLYVVLKLALTKVSLFMG